MVQQLLDVNMVKSNEKVWSAHKKIKQLNLAIHWLQHAMIIDWGLDLDPMNIFMYYIQAKGL